MKTQEQVKCAVDTISLLQDYITLVKIEKSMKSAEGQSQLGEMINSLRDKAYTNVGKVL